MGLTQLQAFQNSTNTLQDHENNLCDVFVTDLSFKQATWVISNYTCIYEGDRWTYQRVPSWF